ncbi:MAG: alpha/beta hydrolase family esterase [Chloroflexota bacterium]
MKARSHTIFIFLAALLLTSLTCEKSPGSLPPASPEPASTSPPVGDSEHKLIYAGVERSYVVHVPSSYDPARPTALVLAFHGITLDAYEMMRISGFNAQSDAAGFIVAYPNAAGDQKSWNGGHCCGEAARNNVDDVGFVNAVIEELSASFHIDPQRIYATGFSNGAILVYRLACQISNRIAAIAPVSATQALEDMQACHPSRPLPLIHFHGTDDEPNPYNGGVTPGGVQFISVDDAIEYWVNFDGCPSEPSHSETGSIIHDVYAPCQAGSSIELYTITGGKHAWPGGEAVNLRMGQPTKEISATALMWDFFLAHPMP